MHVCLYRCERYCIAIVFCQFHYYHFLWVCAFVNSRSLLSKNHHRMPERLELPFFTFCGWYVHFYIIPVPIRFIGFPVYKHSRAHIYTENYHMLGRPYALNVWLMFALHFIYSYCLIIFPFSFIVCTHANTVLSHSTIEWQFYFFTHSHSFNDGTKLLKAIFSLP